MLKKSIALELAGFAGLIAAAYEFAGRGAAFLSLGVLLWWLGQMRDKEG